MNESIILAIVIILLLVVILNTISAVANFFTIIHMQQIVTSEWIYDEDGPDDPDDGETVEDDKSTGPELEIVDASKILRFNQVTK